MFLVCCVSVQAQLSDLVFRLPTDNETLFTTGGDDYYMYVDRNFEGEKTRPWQGGTYGMVRNPSAPVRGHRFSSAGCMKELT